MIDLKYQNKFVSTILLSFLFITFSYIINPCVFYCLAGLVTIYILLILIFFLLDQKCPSEFVHRCFSVLFRSFSWMMEKITGDKDVRIAVSTTIVLLLAFAITLSALVIFLRFQSDKTAEFSCFVMYIIFTALPIFSTSSFFAKFINNHLEKQNPVSQYDPELVRKVFFGIYFVLLVFSTYLQLKNVESIVWLYIVRPAFLTFIAHDAAFHQKYQLESDESQGPGQGRD